MFFLVVDVLLTCRVSGPFPVESPINTCVPISGFGVLFPFPENKQETSVSFPCSVRFPFGVGNSPLVVNSSSVYFLNEYFSSYNSPCCYLRRLVQVPSPLLLLLISPLSDDNHSRTQVPPSP